MNKVQTQAFSTECSPTTPVVSLKHVLQTACQWDAQFERALNVIDPHTSSKLMVTTRIRGLIQGGREVAIGTLSQRDALQLLAATAEVEEYVPPEEGKAEEDDQYRYACAVVDHCGYLALTVSTSDQIYDYTFYVGSDIDAFHSNCKAKIVVK